MCIYSSGRINVMNKCIVGYEDFYISELNELIDIRAAYCAWLMSKRQTGFNIITDRYVRTSISLVRNIQLKGAP